MDPRRIKIERTITTGAHGKIQLGRDLETFEPLAIKRINLDDSSSLTYYNEVTILSTLTPHKNFPKLHGNITKHSKGFIIMEYLPFPTLSKMLKDKGAFSEDQALYILKQIIDAVIYMTDREVAHRDLKSENIIINPDNLTIKIIDFGLGKTDVKLEDTDTHPIGTPVYMAPGVLTCDDCKPYKIIASDMWSVGIIYWECLLGYNPFVHVGTKKELIKRQLEEKDFSNYSPTSQNLLESLLLIDENKRMTAKEARGFMKYMGKWRYSSVDVNSSAQSSPLSPSKTSFDKTQFLSYRFSNRRSSDDVFEILRDKNTKTE